MTGIEPAGEKEVLAILHHDEPGQPVTETAAVMARLAGGEVRQLRLAAGLTPPQQASQVMQALGRPGTLSGVLASSELTRPLWQHIAQQSAKPVVLVPPGPQDRPPVIRRVLLPLDGTAQSAAAIAEAAGQLARGGIEIVVLHVFDAETVPRFWDQHAHAGHAWEQEFLARYCALPGARLELRSGDPAGHVVQVAREQRADMIALAWAQRLQPGHALVVRRAVLVAGVPVILIPVPVTSPADITNQDEHTGSAPTASPESPAPRSARETGLITN